MSAFPFVPGHEVVGEVVAVGSEVTGLRVGDRAGVGWISNSCRVCANCKRGEENICVKGYTGLIVMGGSVLPWTSSSMWTTYRSDLGCIVPALRRWVVFLFRVLGPGWPPSRGSRVRCYLSFPVLQDLLSHHASYFTTVQPPQYRMHVPSFPAQGRLIEPHSPHLPSPCPAPFHFHERQQRRLPGYLPRQRRLRLHHPRRPGLRVRGSAAVRRDHRVRPTQVRWALGG